MVGYSCVIMLLWGRQLLIIGNCFAMGLRGTTTTSLSKSGNYWNESLLISSIIILQQTQVRHQRTYLPLMTLITRELCIPVRDSSVPVILLVIQRSERYRISRSLLLRIMLLAIWLRRKLNWREGGIIG